jgi:hypothetical protein
MVLLKIMLRLFTTIFGTTHPAKDEEDKYALLLFGLIVLIVAAMAAVAWIVANFVK